MKKLLPLWLLCGLIVSCEKSKKVENVVSEAEYDQLATKFSNLEKQHADFKKLAQKEREQYKKLNVKNLALVQSARRVVESLHLLERNNYLLNIKYQKMNTVWMDYLNGKAADAELRPPEDEYFEGLRLQQMRLTELLDETEGLAFWTLGEHTPEYSTLSKEFGEIEKRIPKWEESFRPQWFEQSSGSLKFIKQIMALHELEIETLEVDTLWADYEVALNRMLVTTAQKAVEQHKAQQDEESNNETGSEDVKESPVNDKQTDQESDSEATKKPDDKPGEPTTKGDKAETDPKKEIPPLKPKKSKNGTPFVL